MLRNKEELLWYFLGRAAEYLYSRTGKGRRLIFKLYLNM